MMEAASGRKKPAGRFAKIMNRYEPKMRELNATIVSFAAGRQPVRVSEEDLREAEHQLGVRFPEDYREFIRDFGVFSVPTVLFSVQSNSVDEVHFDGSLEIFYGIIAQGEQSSALDIVRSYFHSNSGAMGENWSPHWLIIGEDAGGNPVLMDIKGDTVGSIYILDDESPIDCSLILVANSFDDFMQMLKTEPEHDEPEATEKADAFWAIYATPFPMG